MTMIYFVRHAEPNYNNHDDLTRELTAKGWSDRKKVTEFFKDKGITKALSSPYKRSIDTISAFTENAGLSIELNHNLRERRVGDGWLDDFDSFARNQWYDFNYKLKNGESLSEVQARNIEVLYEILNICEGEAIIVGTHGTALSTIINYYDPSFGYYDFMKIKDVMPWVAEMRFDGVEFILWQEHRL